MSRPPASPKLPAIAVEDENVKRSISLPRELDDELAAYAEYFQAHSGKKPRSSDDVIVGLLNAYLANEVLFQKWKKERPNRSNSSGVTTFAAKAKGGPAPQQPQRPADKPQTTDAAAA